MRTLIGGTKIVVSVCSLEVYGLPALVTEIFLALELSPQEIIVFSHRAPRPLPHTCPLVLSRVMYREGPGPAGTPQANF